MKKNYNFRNFPLSVGLLLIGLLLFKQSTFAQQPGSSKKWKEPFSKSSEYRTWSIGAHAGILSQANIFDIGVEFTNLQYNLGYGGFVRKQILPAFALQAEFLGGKVSGWEGENLFETKLQWSGSITTHFTLGNINWRHQDGFLKPYLNVGFGYMAYLPYNYVDEEEFIWTTTEGMFIPAGVGLKFKISQGINLDLGYRMNFTRTKAFDGVSSEFRDAFSYAHGGLEFNLGPRSKPVLANSNPVAEMYHAQQAKYDELYAAMEKQKADFAEREKVLTEDNKKVKSQIERIYADFADADRDGVADRYDKCPDTPIGVQVDGSGCPIDAPAPTTIIQQIVVSDEDRKIVDEAIKNLEFDLGKATIRPSSYASLNKVAILLIEKRFSLKLAGHTDNTGAGDLNMRLSKNRAEAVKTYLVSKGAQASRIEATGYGHTQPIASNQTEEGRQKNRRVEFTLY